MLAIIRGIPGSGKSTMAKKNANTFTHYEADMFFIDENNEYKYNRDKIGEAHEWCKQSVFFSLKEGTNVVVSNTFIKPWELKPYFEFCLEHRIKITAVDLFTEYNSIHNVPLHVIDRMKREFMPLYNFTELFDQVKTYLCYK